MDGKALISNRLQKKWQGDLLVITFEEETRTYAVLP